MVWHFHMALKIYPIHSLWNWNNRGDALKLNLTRCNHLTILWFVLNSLKLKFHRFRWSRKFDVLYVHFQVQPLKKIQSLSRRCGPCLRLQIQMAIHCPRVASLFICNLKGSFFSHCSLGNERLKSPSRTVPNHICNLNKHSRRWQNV